jgi:hypothetical protein
MEAEIMAKASEKDAAMKKAWEVIGIRNKKVKELKKSEEKRKNIMLEPVIRKIVEWVPADEQAVSLPWLPAGTPLWRSDKDRLGIPRNH